MINKVAVDKVEIDRLIRLRRYDEACEFIRHVRDVIELVVINRIDILIKNEIIMEKERRTFYKTIKESIIDKLLMDEGYILIDESYVSEKKSILEDLKEKRKVKR